MFERLESKEKRYLELKEELSKPEVLNDYNLVKKLSKELSDLEDVVVVYEKLKQNKQELEELKELLNDDEMREFAQSEIESITVANKELEEKIELLLVPKDENDGKNIIMEIRGAAGGDEANIFAGDLLRMYTYYAEKNNWKVEILSQIEGASGGFSQVECLIKGENVYSKLKYENGSHRVQRIPNTESGGRIHTSTATVLVIPEVEDVNIDVKESDLKIDVYHSSGAGGQSVNTANSAVRITHLPTGIVVTCQTERSQLKNKDRALKMLKVKMYDEQVQKQEQEIGEERKTKIGSGDRSEKIRTYNYPQNRVTDHRINFSVMELDRVMDGSIDSIIEALITEDYKLKLAGEKNLS